MVKKKGTSHGALFINSLNESLKLSHLFFGNAFSWFNVVIVEQIGEHVGNGLVLWVAHDVDGGIDAFGHQLMLQQVAATVASDDTAHFPEAEVVEELTAGDSDFAH